MSNSANLLRFLGTEVIVDLWPAPSTGPSSETWKITERIAEEVNAIHEAEAAEDHPQPTRVGHSATTPTRKSRGLLS